MADVFISYSRKDTDFVRRLTNVLSRSGRDVWVDWQDIPRGENWLNEIFAGIEQADTFLVVVSRHSLMSEICNDEIRYARERSKRIFPLIREEIKDEVFNEVVGSWYGKTWEQKARENWTEIGHRNWVFFNDDSRFDPEFDVLAATLETDQAHVRAHTRYLVRALEWDRGGRKPSLLLISDEITAAESWLKDAEDKAPLPTPLHQAYIQESRRAEDERQRQAEAQTKRVVQFRRASVVLGVVAVIAFLATLGAGIASVQSSNQAATATHAQGEAEHLSTEVQASATQLAADVAYFSLQQDRVATLAAAAVVVPLGSPTLEPTSFVATLTQVAILNNWQPIEATYDHDGYEVVMVQVPPGCFYMGSVSGPDEQPIHIQCIDQPFWIDKFEVTNAQYAAVTGEEPPSAFIGDLNPVDSITWFAARDFCRMRDARLPTEREWEYAARGPDSLIYPWGNTLINDAAVYNRPESAGDMPVMDEDGNQLRPQGASWVGAVDMAGNLWEWTSTRYDDLDYSRQLLDFQGLYPYPYRADDGRESDETVEEYEARRPIYPLRVMRGGSFINNEDNLRAANRGGDDPGLEDTVVGFRCVRSNSAR